VKRATGLTVLLALGLLAARALALPPVFIPGDFDTALAKATKEGKLVFLYLYSEHVVDGQPRKLELCQRVEDTALTDPELLRVLSEVVCVAASIDEGNNRALLGSLKLDPAYPTFAWIDKDQRVLGTMGACFVPSAYIALTRNAQEIEALLHKAERTPDDSIRLGTLYFDTGRYAQSAEVLRRVLIEGVGTPADRIVCAFALRAAKEDVEAVDQFNEVLTACQAREPLRGEVNLGPGVSAPYSPIALERDGKLVGLLTTLGPAKDMVRVITDFEWALTTDPQTPSDCLRAARIFYDRENWVRAGELYARADGAGLSDDEREECAGRAGIAALRVGDQAAAEKAFDRYLADFKGPNRPTVLFFRATLLLAKAVEVDANGELSKVTDKKSYERAGEMLVQLMRDYRDSEWGPATRDLLTQFYPGRGDSAPKP
jgi:tetratricopeptide (TPR) repeat protein